MTHDIKVLKMGKFSSQKNIDNIEKEYDKSNQIGIVGDKESNKREKIE